MYIRATAWQVVTKMNSYAKSADTYECDASRLIVGRVLMLDLPMRKGDNNLNSPELEREHRRRTISLKNRNIPDEPQLVANAFKLNLSKCLNAFFETVQNKSINSSRLSSVCLLYTTRATSSYKSVLEQTDRQLQRIKESPWNWCSLFQVNGSHFGFIPLDYSMQPDSRFFFVLFLYRRWERFIENEDEKRWAQKNKIKYNTAGCTVSISCFPSTFSLLSLSPFSLSTARWESNYRMKSPVKDRVRYL